MKCSLLVSLVLATCIGFAPARSYAEEEISNDSGSFLFAVCTAALEKPLEDTESYFYCHTVIDAVIGTLSITQWTMKKPFVCWVEGTTRDQLARVIVRYIVIHPELLSGHIGPVAVLAFHDAFPCPKAK